MQLIRPDTSFDFIGRRKPALALSGLLVLASIVLLVVKGLNFGIDFTGGTLVEVKFQHPPAIADVRQALKPAGYGQAVIQEYGAPDEILIRVQNKAGEKSSTISTAVLGALSKRFGKSEVTMRRVEYVGPQVGRELTRAGIIVGDHCFVKDSAGSDRCSPVVEGRRFPSGKVHRVHVADTETGCFDEIGDDTVEMTAAGDDTPDSIEPVLPAPYGRIRCGSVFAENQLSVRFQNPVHLFQS